MKDNKEFVDEQANQPSSLDEKETPIKDAETTDTENVEESNEASEESDSEQAKEDASEQVHEDSAEDKLQRIEEELNKKKDDYLRLVAEFDNYRRRVSKEKLDLIATASEGVIKGLLPIVDDFERAIAALSDSDDSQAAKEGTELIYKKLMDFLKNNGVKEIEALGKELDTDFHEAIAQVPAQNKKERNRIIDVTQKGYMLGDKVIRYAKVVVGS